MVLFFPKVGFYAGTHPHARQVIEQTEIRDFRADREEPVATLVNQTVEHYPQ